MGFSLELFFEDLQEIIEDKYLNESGRLAALEKAIKEAREYAKQCNQI